MKASVISILSAFLFASAIGATGEVATNISGTVTAVSPHERFVYIAADDGKAWRGDFWYSTFPQGIARGDRLEMRGRLGVGGDVLARLVDAAPVSVDRNGGRIVDPADATIAELCRHPARAPGARDWWGVRVSTSGRIVDINRRDMWAQILLKDGTGAHLQAFFLRPYDKPLEPDFQIGAEVNVDGIALYTPERAADTGNVTGINNPLVYVERAEDFRFLNPASWWTASRLAVALALVSLVLVAVMSWAVLQRRKRLEERNLADAIRRERLMLSSELHDNFQQLLAGCMFRLGAATQLAGDGNAPEVAELEKLGELLAHAQNDLRVALWGMREEAEGPTALSALLKYAADRMPHWQGKVFFRTAGEERPLSRRHSGIVLLILQEAIGNALKHANPSRIDVTVTFCDGFAAMSVKDDGVGFDTGKLDDGGTCGLGVMSMRNRVEAVGGVFSIVSSPGCGTEVKVEVNDV